MKFEIYRASCSWELPCTKATAIEGKNEKFEIEINSLEDLIQLSVEVGGIVIENDKSIIIYDDYIE